SRSRISPTTSSASGESHGGARRAGPWTCGSRLSNTVTWSPRSTRASTRCDPTKPAPPVTSTLRCVNSYPRVRVDYLDQDLERAQQPVTLGFPSGPGLGHLRRDGEADPGRPAGSGLPPSHRPRWYVSHRPWLSASSAGARGPRMRGHPGGARLPHGLEPLVAHGMAGTPGVDPHRVSKARLDYRDGRFFFCQRGGRRLGSAPVAGAVAWGKGLLVQPSRSGPGA